MGAFANRLGTRFLLVTVVPNILLVGYVGILLAAGAPACPPSLARVLAAINHLTAHQIVAILLGILIISVVSHPLQIPLIQILEGYWWGLPFGPKLAKHATRRFRDEWVRVDNELKQEVRPKDLTWAIKNSRAQAQNRKDWLPEDMEDLRPTALGNALRTGEVIAGERYGLDLNLALPRIIPSMSSDILAELSDRRNQLDAAVRLCVVSGIASFITIGLLIWHGPWLFLVLAPYLFCWASYRASVAAARGFSTTLAAAVDLHHLQLYDVLSLERPANIAEEKSRNETLVKLFRGDYLDSKDRNVLRYATPRVGDKEEPAIAPPPEQDQDSAGP